MGTVTIRRRQQDRTAEARRRLLEATVDCLARHGWHGTTTMQVADMAGLSRGAMQHHFGSKLDLVAAATAHLLDGARERALETVQRLRPGPDAVRTLVQRLWRRLIDSPRYHAMLEIHNAARSDDALRLRVEADLRQLGVDVTTAMAERFRVRPGGVDVETLTAMTFALLRGLALEAPVQPDPARIGRILETWAGMMDAQLGPAEAEQVQPAQ